jgi:hypothetical protein
LHTRCFIGWCNKPPQTPFSMALGGMYVSLGHTAEKLLSTRRPIARHRAIILKAMSLSFRCERFTRMLLLQATCIAYCLLLVASAWTLSKKTTHDGCTTVSVCAWPWKEQYKQELLKASLCTSRFYRNVLTTCVCNNWMSQAMGARAGHVYQSVQEGGNYSHDWMRRHKSNFSVFP